MSEDAEIVPTRLLKNVSKDLGSITFPITYLENTDENAMFVGHMAVDCDPPATQIGIVVHPTTFQPHVIFAVFGSDSDSPDGAVFYAAPLTIVRT